MVCLMRTNRSYRIVRNADKVIGRVQFDNSPRFAWSSMAAGILDAVG